MLGVSAAPQATNEILTDDPSRGELFELMRSYLEAEALPGQRQQYKLQLTFSFPHDALWKDPLQQSEQRINQLFGIDLSHHNADACRPLSPCQIDWDLLSKQQVRFAYLKASQGVSGIDPYFDVYRKGARRLPSSAKVYVGPYHFLSANGTPEAQAAHFLAVIANKLADDDLPPDLDLEADLRMGADKKLILGRDNRPYDFWTPVPSAQILNRALTWLTVVAKATGRKPVLYTNREWWRQRIGDEAKFEAFRAFTIWISDYSVSGLGIETPHVPNNSPWTIWQFTDNARFESGGIGGGRVVDASVFNGTYVSFQKAFGVTQ
jgi:lysozyme